MSDPLAAGEWKLVFLFQGQSKGAGLRATSVARPSGHSLRECSLRHPASAVPPSREWRAKRFRPCGTRN